MMSLARNGLDRVPYVALSLVNSSLEYLSLAENVFNPTAQRNESLTSKFLPILKIFFKSLIKI